MSPERLSVVLVVLMALQAGLSLLFPDLYRDTGYVRATWFGNDLVTLAVAVPCMVGGMRLGARGSVPGWMLWAGTLGYAVYNYAFYLLGAALNTFFPLYAFAFVTAAAALILALVKADVGWMASRFGPQAPTRIIGGYMVIVAIGLATVWLGMWAAHVFAGRPIPVGPEAFRLVAALDLTIMVPALGGGGVLLARKQPWGYVISTIAGIQGTMYLLVLSLNSGLFMLRGSVPPPGDLPIWGGLAVATGAATALLLASARGGPSPNGGMAPRD